ncbi:MAG TPA: TIGR02996 domain-containing protein, partial [Gemmataceae bacterium]|nr:TIGR02996 domain-containing protein [Gemmataceae bacterium]
MSEEQSFLDALRENPADDTTRLVYADWLDDRGDAARAAYLRAVVELTWREPGADGYTAAAAELFRTVTLT